MTGRRASRQPPPTAGGATEAAAAEVERLVGPGFDVDRFIGNFEVVVEATGGGRLLRDVIVEFAIRGRLGTGDRRDDPADLQLRKVVRPSKSGEKPIGSTPTAEGWDLPPGWWWARPGVLGVVAPRNDARDDDQVGFLPMQGVPIDYRAPLRPEARRWGDIRKGYTHLADGDVAVAKITPCFQNGKSCVVRGLQGGIGAGTTELHVLRPAPGVAVAKYLLLFFKSPGFVTGGVARMTGTAGQQRVPADYFASVPLPLPPLAEQHRIVAKVDQLMALCDELEVRQERKRSVGTRLTRSALEALTEAEGPEEFEKAWKRVAENFAELAGHSARIADVRTAILGLALRGRLVRQLAEEGTAQTLLRQIGLSQGGPGETEDGGLPQTWAWAPVARIADSMLGKMLDRSKHTKGTLRPYLRNLNVRWFGFDLSDLRQMYFEDDELERYGVQVGDVLICEGGDPGRAAVWRADGERPLIQKAIHRARLRPGVVPEWLVLNLRFDTRTGRLGEYFTGATIKHFTGRALDRYTIRLPPTGEQRRIVTAFERLMLRCDELEARLEFRDRQSTKLAESLVAEAVA